MPNNDLPGTLDTKHGSISANLSPQTTTAPESSASTEATPVLDLRGYELLERLGGGGMGDVYRAGDPALGRDLAVKVMKAELQAYAAGEQRFLREARVTGSLQHPGIVPIYNLGRLTDGRLHYTMRLVRGRTLADILKDEAGQPERLPALLAIFEKVCQAVAYAHSKKVLHRDLKPSNIMVGRFGEVQVMDWGLAKLLTPGERGCVSAPSGEEEAGTRIHTEDAQTPPDLTRMGREMGTPAYMPPEQALGEWDTVDERADVFALGAILCEILTGRPPYSGSDGAEALRKAKRGDCAEALARLENCGADVGLLALCRDCLTPARESRPRDAEQVAQRVAEYQAEVQERLRRAELERTAAVVKAGEEGKRRRWMLAAVLMLLAGAVVGIWQAVRATNAERLARQNEGQALTAAQAERQAKELAENRLGQIERANDVLTAVFRDLNPRTEEKGGPNLRQQLSQHLQRAAAQLDEAAIGDAVAAARLQATLGHSLSELGQAKLASELLSKAERTFRAKLGPDDPETLTCRNNLATVYLDAGRSTEAIRLYEQILKQREAQLGADHRDTIISRNNLAVAYRIAGRTADAIRLHEQTLKQLEAQRGADHLDTLQSRNNLANAYEDAGRTVEAIRMHQQNLKQYEAQRGTDHPDTLQSRNNLANAYHAAGRDADAIRLYEQNLKHYEVKLGLDHLVTLTSRNNLAEACRTAGRFAEAIRLHEQNLKHYQAKLPTDHRDTLTCRNNLALAYWSDGRTAEAIHLFEENLKLLEAQLGPDHPHTLVAMASLGAAYRDTQRLKDAIVLLQTALERGRRRTDGLPASLVDAAGNLAETYERAGQFAKAESIYRQTLAQARRQYGGDDPRTAGILTELGVYLLKQKRFTEAAALLRQSLTIRDKKQTDKWTTFNTRSALGEALMGQKKYAEAEPLLLQGYEGMKQRQDKIPAPTRQIRLTEALERLVRLYEAAKQTDKAADWRKKLDETKSAQKKPKP